MLSLEKKDYSLTRSHNRYTSKNIKNTNLRIKETESTFHYELKIPGYVKEDFNFYVSQDYLVVTTGRSKMNGLVIKIQNTLIVILLHILKLIFLYQVSI
ncbi:hypothetical protein JCM19301_3592 [Jejuia pallidilutea]|uniref:SHSP domain-containing protein n=1 Tax=Jejuia pallidilutea TaxID=504487 RepID=A0A090WEG1_9FLAO|nr:hypothetical protein [Jejuia pallidilutea]GAL65907.1 hypothetical protein JCM19301_3592 [Jejuia pallidilutea]